MMENTAKNESLSRGEILDLLPAIMGNKFEHLFTLDIPTGELCQLVGLPITNKWTKTNVSNTEELKSFLGASQFNRLFDLIKAGRQLLPSAVSYGSRYYLAITHLAISIGHRNPFYKIKMVPVRFNTIGQPTMVVCGLSPSPPDEEATGRATIVGAGGMFILPLSYIKEQWHPEESVSISRREIDVISLTALGFSIPQIADKLCLSISTINKTKHAFNQKMGCTNTMEAINMARIYGLL